MGAPIEIRTVQPADAAAIADIYAYHVLNGTASYEIEPPSIGHTNAKIARITQAGWPFLVAEQAGALLAYAYAIQFPDRPAYRFTCENSIYVRGDSIGRGIGKRLLAALCKSACQAGFRQMIAVVGGAEPASIGLHSTCGFDTVGRLRAVGWKKDRWLDTVYMQRSLQADDPQ